MHPVPQAVQHEQHVPVSDFRGLLIGRRGCGCTAAEIEDWGDPCGSAAIAGVGGGAEGGEGVEAAEFGFERGDGGVDVGVGEYAAGVGRDGHGQGGGAGADGE